MIRRSAARAAWLAVCGLVAAFTVSALGAFTAGAATGPTAGAPPRALLRAFACTPALDPPNRSIAVTAVMRPLAATKRMAVKFDLLMTSGTGAPRAAVRAGGLGAWITPSNATLGQRPGDVWNLQKSVVDLAAPAVYEFRATFRWTGVHGRTLGTVVRYSRRCRQRELRPQLVVSSITVAPVSGRPDRQLYTAVIANTGNSAAGPFEVLFAPADGTGSQTRTVSALRAHARMTEAFVGPLCSAATDPTITADATTEVDVVSRVGSARTATCPAPTGT